MFTNTKSFVYNIIRLKFTMYYYHIYFSNCKPEKDTLADYLRRCTFLKGLIKTEHLENPSEKVLAVQLLSHGHSTTESNLVANEIHQKTSNKAGKELKDELFGIKKKGRTFIYIISIICIKYNIGIQIFWGIPHYV